MVNSPNNSRETCSAFLACWIYGCNRFVVPYPPDKLWIRHVYADGLEHENHDIITKDINNDKIPDIISYAQRHNGGTLRWYDTSDPNIWIRHEVASSVNELVIGSREGSRGIHGGFAPAGIGDLDNDKYADIVMPPAGTRIREETLKQAGN
jgi:hypothetical protein